MLALEEVRYWDVFRILNTPLIVRLRSDILHMSACVEQFVGLYGMTKYIPQYLSPPSQQNPPSLSIQLLIYSGRILKQYTLSSDTKLGQLSNSDVEEEKKTKKIRVIRYHR